MIILQFLSLRRVTLQLDSCYCNAVILWLGLSITYVRRGSLALNNCYDIRLQAYKVTYL